MRSLCFPFLAALLLFPAAAWSQDDVQITKFLRLVTPIYDQAGNEVRRIPSKELPKVLRVDGVSESGDLKAVLQGGIVFFNPADVVFSGRPKCSVSAEANRNVSGVASGRLPSAQAEVGRSAGASSSKAACIPIKR